MFLEFPKWLYHDNEKPLIVASREAQDALGVDWRETPNKLTDNDLSEEQDEQGEQETAEPKRRGRPPKA
jgi:hypothetical protein